MIQQQFNDLNLPQNRNIQNMKLSYFVLIFFFTFNSWVYLQFDTTPRIAQIIQAVLALLSIGCVAWLRISTESIPFILIILFTGILLTFSFHYDVLHYFMFLPLLYNLGLKRIINKYLLILQVLAESIWMFLSIMFCFCIFGYVSHRLFKQNEDYFATPVQSALTYLQVATLDQVGRVTILNYLKFGFMESFGMMVASLAIFHILFNINQAIIMQYVYRKRHNEAVISSRRNLLDQQIEVKFRIVRIINVVATSLIFLVPSFEKGVLQNIIFGCTGVSALSILIQHMFEGNVTGIRNVLNIISVVSIGGMYLSEYYGICYLLCGVRIFLIREVIGLWWKLVNVLWELSPILSLTLVFFLVFSLLAYNLEKAGGESSTIQVAFIKALQFMTLDDWTSHLREGPWYVSLLIIIYIIMLNHILLNAIISQSFGELEEEAELERLRGKEMRLTRFQKEDAKTPDEVQDEKSADDFWEIALALNYEKKQLLDGILAFINMQGQKQEEKDLEMMQIV